MDPDLGNVYLHYLINFQYFFLKLLENSCVESTTLSVPKITASLLEILSNGKLANVEISFKELNQEKDKIECAGREEDAEEMQDETNASIEKSVAEVIDILYNQKGRLKITLTLMCETNKILVNGADLKLVNSIAAVEHVVNIDGEESAEKKKRKIWKRFKSIWRLKNGDSVIECPSVEKN